MPYFQEYRNQAWSSARRVLQRHAESMTTAYPEIRAEVDELVEAFCRQPSPQNDIESAEREAQQASLMSEIRRLRAEIVQQRSRWSVRLLARRGY